MTTCEAAIQQIIRSQQFKGVVNRGHLYETLAPLDGNSEAEPLNQTGYGSCCVNVLMFVLMLMLMLMSLCCCCCCCYRCCCCCLCCRSGMLFIEINKNKNETDFYETQKQNQMDPGGHHNDRAATSCTLYRHPARARPANSRAGHQLCCW